MSLFTDLDLPLNPKDTVVSIAVSNSYYNPSVSVMTPNKILLFNESGEKHDYELSRNIAPSYICWHPHLPQIAIGWFNGTITIWNEENKMAKEEGNVHKDKISVITFSPSGSRMVTADAKGLVAVWRGINCIATYKKEGTITHCIFADLSLESKIKSQNLFFFGGSSGIVCLADDAKHCSDVCKVVGSIKSLLFYQKENSVIIISSTLLLVQFRISSNDKTGPDKKVKLSISNQGDAEKLRSIWIGNQLLSTVSHENMIRMWHLEEDDNYALTLPEMQNSDGSVSQLLDRITVHLYETMGKVLVAGTNKGNLLFWKNISVGQESPNIYEAWKPMPYIPFEQEINQLAVGKNSGLIALHFGNEVALISETIIKGKLSQTLKLLQTSADKVQIYLQNDITKQMLVFDSKEASIKGLDCSESHMLIWTNKKIEIYEVISGLKDASTKLIGQFNEKCFKIALYKESVILAQQYGLNIANYKGIVKQSITFSESEGKLSNIDLMNNFLVMWTANNYIRIFDLSRREVKQVGLSRKFENSSGPLGHIRQCTINSEGQKVVIIADPVKQGQNEEAQSGSFYVYDVEMDNFLKYDLGYDMVALDGYFDYYDQRFFGVLVNQQKSARAETRNVDHTQVLDFNQQEEEKQTSNPEESPYGNLKLVTFFVTSQQGIKKQDEYPLEKNIEGVFAIRIPNIYYIQRNETNDPNNSYKIHEGFMNDFSGIDGEIDKPIREAIMNFSYYLTTGNLDEAYKSVKAIQKPQIWEKMAAMSVKTRRIDVSEVCLGNMRFARGARAIRESKKEPELEAQLAMVAIQLNMKDQATKLYEESKRYDLLNQMYQADGQWEKALQISEKHDRMNLKNTHYKRARFYEISKNFDEAITHYELSGTHRKEVPRMLLEDGQTEMLEDYIQEKQDKELFKFWAQYLESKSSFDQAAQFYRKAEDYSSIIRILCHKKDHNAAKQLCMETNDPASCYFLAKQLELENRIPEAIDFYKKSQNFAQASKLARDMGMDQEVMAIAHQASAQVKLLSAAYFEEKKFIDKAYELYKKGKNFTKAMEIAKKNLGDNEVQEIQRLIGQEISRQQHDNAEVDSSDLPSNQAVPLLIKQKKFEQAHSLVLSNNIPITEDLLKQLTPDSIPETKRKQMLFELAEHLKIQDNKPLATKIFIQLGEKVEAMKCLINLGAVDKVIKFAQQARQDEIYVLAANFLQTTDLNTNPDMMKNIIQFYMKAKAFDNLAGFFDSCSQIEIDQYRDYEKAIAALKEALKYANKSTNQDKDTKIQNYQQKIFLIEKFVQARNLVQQNPQEMVQLCNQLLENPNIESAVRSGDIFAHLIEFYFSQRNFEQAYGYIQQMEAKRIVLAPYLDSGMLQQIYEQVGHNPNQQQQQQQQNNNNNTTIIMIIKMMEKDFKKKNLLMKIQNIEKNDVIFNFKKYQFYILYNYKFFMIFIYLIINF